MAGDASGHKPGHDTIPAVDAAEVAPACGTPLSSRPVRSFTIRNGRLTAAQAEAVERLLPRYGLPYTGAPIDLDDTFGRTAPRWLEIGFGNGDALIAMARDRPDIDFVGIEVHAPGVGRALRAIERESLENVRLIRHDAVDVLEHMLPSASFERVLLLFPDPWRKKRHHKRRIVQPTFMALVVRVLEQGGEFHAATDWADYADWMLEVLEAVPELENASGRGCFAPRPHWRLITRFESRGLGLGHAVRDLLYRRC